MLRKVVSCLIGASIAVGSIAGCSDAVTVADGPDGGAMKEADSGGTDTAPPRDQDSGGQGGPSSCYKPESAVTSLPFGPPKAAQGVCTTADIDRIQKSCFTVGPAACQAAKDAAKACGDCIFGVANGPFPAYLTYADYLADAADGSGTVTLMACTGLVVGRPECGPAFYADRLCGESACSTCDAANKDACEKKARDGRCKDVYAAAKPCFASLVSQRSTTDAVCLGNSPVESFRKVASYFCGAPQDAGGGG
jgi:hypothetical protein